MRSRRTRALRALYYARVYFVHDQPKIGAIEQKVNYEMTEKTSLVLSLSTTG